MPRPRFRPTFLWKFTFATAAVALLAAAVFVGALDAAHRRAVRQDAEVAALGRISAELTAPLDALDAGASPNREHDALRRIANDATFFQDVTGFRLYAADGRAVYPAGIPAAPARVRTALRADSFTHGTAGESSTTFAPYYTRAGRAYVIAVDFSSEQFERSFRKEAAEVLRIVAVVVAILFGSLVTLAAGASRELERRRRESQSTFLQTLAIMADTIDLRDPYTAGHSRRVARYSRALAEAVGLPPGEVGLIESGALLHDIGKIGVPDAVLYKPARLDGEERRLISAHPTIGARLLGGVPSMADVVPCVLHHHEKIDGTGYPDGLAAEAIPFGARVIAVADAFDAITTNRPYRSARTAAEAIAELRRVAGTQLDARLVAAFAALVERGALGTAIDPGTTVFGRRSELASAAS